MEHVLINRQHKALRHSFATDVNEEQIELTHSLNVDKLFETMKKICVHVLPCTLIIHSTITKEIYDEELRGAP